MPWEIFVNKHYPGKVALSINKYGRIYWNRKTHEQIGKPEYLELLVDKERGLLGLRKAIAAQSSFAVCRDRLHNVYSISAKGPLGACDLLPTQTIREPAKFEGDILCIDIGNIKMDLVYDELVRAGI